MNAMDTETGFAIEHSDEESILVRHVEELHRYAFFIANEEGRRFLGESVTIGNNGTANDGADFAAEARGFAERQARELNLID